MPSLEVSVNVGVVVVLILLLVFYHLVRRMMYRGGAIGHPHMHAHAAKTERMDTAGFATDVSNVNTSAINQPTQKAFGDMMEGEKVQFIIDTYFTSHSDDEEVAQSQGKEDAYINSLPVSDQGCTDDYDDCQKWADNGECTINPEYMLYACPKACKACALTPQQKHDVTVIYNQREPARCVNHGENYPGNFPYINRMYDYNVHYE